MAIAGGIGLAADVAGGAVAAGVAEAGAGFLAADVIAGALPEIVVGAGLGAAGAGAAGIGAGAFGLGEAGLAAATAAGLGAAGFGLASGASEADLSGLTVQQAVDQGLAVPTGEQGAGLSLDQMASIPTAPPSMITPEGGVSSFGPGTSGFQIQTPQLGAGQPVGPSAAGFTPPAGVNLPPGAIDPTSAAATGGGQQPSIFSQLNPIGTANAEPIPQSLQQLQGQLGPSFQPPTNANLYVGDNFPGAGQGLVAPQAAPEGFPSSFTGSAAQPTFGGDAFSVSPVGEPGGFMQGAELTGTPPSTPGSITFPSSPEGFDPIQNFGPNPVQTVSASPPGQFAGDIPMPAPRPDAAGLGTQLAGNNIPLPQARPDFGASLDQLTSAPSTNVGAATPAQAAPAAPSAPAQVASAAAGPAPGAPTSALDKLIANPMGTLGEGAAASLTKNPLGIGLGALGLGTAIMTGQKETAATKQIQAQQQHLAEVGAGLVGQGQALTQYLQNGSLPPNLQAQVDQAVKTTKTRIISNYASQGMSTDPKKNSMLAQELSAADQQGIILAGQLETQLFNAGGSLISSGGSFVGLQDQLLLALSNIDQTQTANVGKAIASFAAAMGGGGSGIKLQLGA